MPNSYLKSKFAAVVLTRDAIALQLSIYAGYTIPSDDKSLTDEVCQKFATEYGNALLWNVGEEAAEAIGQIAANTLSDLGIAEGM